MQEMWGYFRKQSIRKIVDLIVIFKRNLSIINVFVFSQRRKVGSREGWKWLLHTGWGKESEVMWKSYHFSSLKISDWCENCGRINSWQNSPVLLRKFCFCPSIVRVASWLGSNGMPGHHGQLWVNQRPDRAALQSKTTRNQINPDRPKMADEVG